jgi:ribosomal protein S18 acetylase RimI-like enzyme
MTDCRIRPARESDLPELARMRRALAAHLAACDPELWELAPEQLAGMADFYVDALKQDNTRILVAEARAGKPVGMIMVRVLNNPSLKPSRFGRIDDAWVEPDFRRQGVMRCLIHTALEFIESRGAAHVMLDYSIKNIISTQAWQRLGFRPALVIAQATLEQVRQGHPSTDPV